VILYDLHLPYANSLKDKRHIVQSLKDRLKTRLNLSVAEVDFQDTWQRCRLAAAWVGIDAAARQKIQVEVDKIVSSRDDVNITNMQTIDY